MAILGRSVPNHAIISQGAAGSSGTTAVVINGVIDGRYLRSKRPLIFSVPRAFRVATTTSATLVITDAPDLRYFKIRRAIAFSVPRPFRVATTPNMTLVVTAPVRHLQQTPPIIWQPLPVDVPAAFTPTPGALVVTPARPLPRPGQPIIGRTGQGATPAPPTPQDADFCVYPPFTAWNTIGPETNWSTGPVATNWRADPPEEC